MAPLPRNDFIGGVVGQIRLLEIGSADVCTQVFVVIVVAEKQLVEDDNLASVEDVKIFEKESCAFAAWNSMEPILQFAPLFVEFFRS